MECRTIPLKWVDRTKLPPKPVWEDSGTGGRPGSVWSINAMNLITLAKGHDAPQEMFYDLRGDRFFLRPEDIKTAKDKDYDASLDRDAVVMEGWLMKKNQKGVEWWKKRYFVLKGQHLSYYLDETEASTDKPKRKIDLGDWVYDDSKAVLKKLGRKNGWELKAKPGVKFGKGEEDVMECAPRQTTCAAMSYVLLVTDFVGPGCSAVYIRWTRRMR